MRNSQGNENIRREGREGITKAMIMGRQEKRKKKNKMKKEEENEERRNREVLD
jgi:hypothetical protein